MGGGVSGVNTISTIKHKNWPGVDSGVMCSITVQNGSGSFDNTLVCRRHRDDCTSCETKRTKREKKKKKRKGNIERGSVFSSGINVRPSHLECAHSNLCCFRLIPWYLSWRCQDTCTYISANRYMYHKFINHPLTGPIGWLFHHCTGPVRQ